MPARSRRPHLSFMLVHRRACELHPPDFHMLNTHRQRSCDRTIRELKKTLIETRPALIYTDTINMLTSNLQQSETGMEIAKPHKFLQLNFDQIVEEGRRQTDIHSANQEENTIVYKMHSICAMSHEIPISLN